MFNIYVHRIHPFESEQRMVCLLPMRRSRLRNPKNNCYGTHTGRDITRFSAPVFLVPIPLLSTYALCVKRCVAVCGWAWRGVAGSGVAPPTPTPATVGKHGAPSPGRSKLCKLGAVAICRTRGIGIGYW